MKLKFDGLETNTDYQALERNYKARCEERAALREERDKLADFMRKGLKENTVVADRIKAIATGKIEPAIQDNDSIRLGEMNRKIRDLDDAIEFLRHQKQGIVSKHSAHVCESLSAQHDALAGEMVTAVIAAQQQAEQFKDFHTTLNDAGILTHSWPDVTPYFLEAGYKHGRLAHWLNEMVMLGVIKRGAVPAKLDFTR